MFDTEPSTLVTQVHRIEHGVGVGLLLGNVEQDAITSDQSSAYPTGRERQLVTIGNHHW
jgi:hypothetical protein